MIAAISARKAKVTRRAPFFDLRSGLFVPCVVTWDSESGEFARVEGSKGFRTWEEAERFLITADA